MGTKKEAIITFKVDSDLADALKAIPNRSEFIRTVMRDALGMKCPLCNGSGVLSPCQQTHWDRFSRSHGLEECGDCAKVHLICESRALPGNS